MISYGEIPKSTTHTILPIMSTLVNSQLGCGENNRKKVLLKQLVNEVFQDPGSTCKQWLTLPNRMVPGPRFSLGFHPLADLVNSGLSLFIAPAPRPESVPPNDCPHQFTNVNAR